MPIIRPARRLVGPLVVFAACAGAAATAAEVVILKDGTVVQGDVRKEKAEIVDKATGRTFVIPRANGFDYVDEGPKYVLFSSHFKQLGEISKDVKLRPETKAYRSPISSLKSQDALPVGGVLQRTTEFDARWRRTFEYKMTNGYDRVEQQVTYLDPYYAFMVSPTHAWRVGYRTAELGPTLVRKLLATHPDLKDQESGVDPARRLAIARFLLDAGWRTDARKEVVTLRETFKDAAGETRDSVDRFVRELDEADADHVVTEAERAATAGRYDAAKEWLDRFPTKAVEPKTTDRAARLTATVRAARDRDADARRLLRAVLDGLAGGAAPPAVGVAPPRLTTDDPATATLAAAAEQILTELHPDSSARLGLFVTQANQPGALAGGKKPAELLALAVSGWVKGRAGTTPSPDAAVRLWDARQTALAYLRSPDINARKAYLSRYRQRADALSLEEMAQVVTLLPPVEPDDLANRGGFPVAAGGSVPDGVFKRTVNLPSLSKPVDYLVRLPAEYRHGRSYPVLVVLHHPGLEAEKLFGGLFAEADRNGYILVGPVWTRAADQPYSFSGNEHAVVTAALRDAGRRYNIDPDRVFLFGFGEGASMALDVGASHPDLFAGVLTMGGVPWWTNMFIHYWKNARLLPVYAVAGEQDGSAVKYYRGVMEKWVSRGFPAMLSVYKGRPLEWFSAEVPAMFDWMAKKRRPGGKAVLNLNPGQLDTVHAWQTMRPTDDRFYWIGADEITDRHRLDQLSPGGSVSPAWVTADIRPGNVIEVRSNGLRRLTVWLGPDMIDLTQPVKVQFNGLWLPDYKKGRKLEADYEVMMEDIHQRGDRKTLYLNKIELRGN